MEKEYLYEKVNDFSIETIIDFMTFCKIRKLNYDNMTRKEIMSVIENDLAEVDIFAFTDEKFLYYLMNRIYSLVEYNAEIVIYNNNEIKKNISEVKKYGRE